MEKRPRKTIKKLARLLVYLLLVVILVPSLVAGLLFVPPVQRYVVQEVVAFGSDYLQTELSLGGLYLEPFKTLRLNEVLIKDQHSDTLLYVKLLKVDVTSFNRQKSRLNIDEITLDHPYFNLYRLEGDTVHNLRFLIDAFTPEKKDTTSTAFSLACDDVDITNLRFKYNDYNAQPRGEEQIDFAHIDIQNFSGSIHDVDYTDSLVAKISGLHLDEQCGLKLRALNTEASLSSKGIRCNKLELVTNRSYVTGSYQMTYDEFGAFSDFFSAVRLSSRLDSAYIHFQDIGFFASSTREMLTPISFSGYAYGPLDDLRAQISEARFAESGSIKGNVRLKGLPDPDALRIDADIDELLFDAADFEALGIPTTGEIQHIPLPIEIHRLGTIRYEGEFIGFLTDFVAIGALETRLGGMQTNVNLKTGDVVRYSGKMATTGFDLGKMLDMKDIGKLAFNLDVQGREFNLDDLYLKAKGRVSYVDLLGYHYQKITLDGEFRERIFDGDFSIDDPNAHIDFTGEINLRNDIPQISCVSRISEVKWAELNLIPEDTFGSFSGDLSLNMEGESMEGLNGKLSIHNVTYKNKTHVISLDSVVLTDELVTEGHRIELNTDIGHASFEGRTNLAQLPYAFIDVGHHFAPDYFSQLKGDHDPQRLDYEVYIENNKSLIDFISPELKVNNPLRLSGQIITAEYYLDVTMDTLSWSFGDAVAKSHTMTIKPKNRALLTSIYFEEFSFANDYFLENLEVSSKLFNDSLLTAVYWDNESSQADSGAFEILAYNNEAFPVNVELNELDARIAGESWTSYSNATLQADSNQLIIKNLDIRSDIGKITSNGTVSWTGDEHLYLNVKGFNLKYLENFGIVKNALNGTFDGTIDVYSVNQSIVANSELQIDSLVIDELVVGKVEGTTGYNSTRQALEMKLDLDYQGTRNVSVNGEFYPFKTTDQLDVEVALNEFRAGIIEPFISTYASNLEGEVNGSISVSGEVNRPQIRGALKLSGFEALVHYLNTTYTIPEGKISIEPGFIGMDHVSVFDEKGEKGFLTATVFHQSFKDISYDLFFDVENFLALNTTLAQNEDYYGKANVTGSISIDGYSDQTNITVEAATNKNTKLSIPLQSSSSASDVEYIRFVPPPDEVVEERKTNETVTGDLKGLNLDFQLAVNDQAEVQLIFDEKIGDIIKVKGEGDIQMKIDNRGSFSMYGEYTMSSGDYLFTLQNIVNKRFSVRPGSKITWNGAPTDAVVDLTAVYDLRASPINLTASVGDTSEVYKKRMPVDVFLNMKGPLLEPNITFDVSLPSLPESDIANQLLDPKTTSDQEMNQQVFALLLTNNFFGQGSGVSAINTTQNTAYELLSNQFSNWISQYFDDLDVGVMVGDQTELNVSKEFFNDRLLVEVNGSVQGDETSTEQTNNVAGEFNAEYKISKDGSLRARVFNEANNYNPTNLNQSPYTQGIGVFYRKEFDTFGGLVKSLFKRKKKDKPNKPDPSKEETEDPSKEDSEVTPEQEAQDNK